MLSIVIILREMYHGRRWMNDTRFLTPMISADVGHVFVNDFIKVNRNTCIQTVKVKAFYQKV
jgi:hypothetical protein